MSGKTILYTASATAHGGRTGKIISEDGNLNIDISVPKDLGGPGTPGATNPEQLFAAGYSACFLSAIGVVGRRAKVDTSSGTVTGKVSLSPNGSGGYVLSVVLTIALPGVEREVVEQIVEKAHQVCPYSNATRGNIDVELVIADA